MRYGLRSLLRAPAFAAPAVTTLALASAAVVGVFTLVNAVLLRPLPYRDPSRIVLVWDTPPDGSRTWLSLPEIDDLSRDARSFSGIAGLTDEQATDRLRQMPGVRAVGAITQLPMSGASLGSVFEMPERDTTRHLDADLRGVTPDYFAVMHMPIMDGRVLTAADTGGRSSIAVVDRSFARRLRPDGNVVGMRIRWIRRPDDPIEIVGIVGDIRHRGLAEDARATVYRPYTQYARGAMTFVVRTGITPSSLAGAASAAIQSIDPAQPLADVAPMEAVVGHPLARPRLSALLASALGLLALVVSAVGVYGVLSYGVSQRVREFAVRLALGARPGQVLSLVLREGVLVTLAGLAIGFALGPVAARTLAAALFNVGPTDAIAYAAAACVLATAATFACYIPARRASRSDPMSVLRSE
jgi:putative ABC transport system permease protein